MKCAVLYYSNSGHTEKLAQAAQARFSADMIRVEPEQAYGGFVSSLARFVKESASKKEPALKTAPRDLSAYDVVFVGFPVWGGTMPKFMQKFIRESTFSPMVTVIPFATAMGSGEASSLETITQLFPGANIAAYCFSTKSKPADVDAWLNEAAESLEEE